MNKFFKLGMLLGVAIALGACVSEGVEDSQEGAQEENRFEITYTEYTGFMSDRIIIVKDNDTEVEYLYYRGDRQGGLIDTFEPDSDKESIEAELEQTKEELAETKEQLLISNDQLKMIEMWNEGIEYKEGAE